MGFFRVRDFGCRDEKAGHFIEGFAAEQAEPSPRSPARAGGRHASADVETLSGLANLLVGNRSGGRIRSRFRASSSTSDDAAGMEYNRTRAVCGSCPRRNPQGCA